MGVLDELNKIKQARRDEIAAAEESRRLAEEAERRAFMKRLADATAQILHSSGLAFLANHMDDVIYVYDRDQRADVRFDLPGHHTLVMRLRRIANGPNDTWRLTSSNIEGSSPWAIRRPGGSEVGGFDSMADALIAAEIEGWVPPAEPAGDHALSPAALHAAREAWVGMIHPDVEPMPPGMAIDYVQEETGGDRDDAVTALHQAAGEWLDSLRPEQGVEASRPFDRGAFAVSVSCRGYLIGEEYNLADNCRAEIVNTCGEVIHDFHQRGDDSIYSADDVGIAHAWLTWCPAAERAIDLCRAVAAAAHPEPAVPSTPPGPPNPPKPKHPREVG